MAKKGRNANLEVGADFDPLFEAVDEAGKKLTDFKKKADNATKSTTGSLTQMVDKGKKELADLAKASDKTAQRLAENAAKAKNLTTEIGNRALEKAAGIDLQEQARQRTIASRGATAIATTAGKMSVVEGSQQRMAAFADERRKARQDEWNERKKLLEAEWQENRERRIEEKNQRKALREAEWENLRQEKIEKKQARDAERTAQREQRAEDKRLNNFKVETERENRKNQSIMASITNRSALAPAAMQAKIQSVLNNPRLAGGIALNMGLGMTRQQAFAAALQGSGIGGAGATFLTGGGGRRPPSLGGGGPGGGAGGFGARFGGLLRGAAGAFGIGVGGYAVGQLGRAVVGAVDQATAYDRQRIAAENLSGSQEKLNGLMVAYHKASGGAVDDSTALANVTRLLATGFADSSGEVEKFVRATRGASIALGKPQDYIIQETQLAISNTSVKRLDQIGLGIQEVNDKIKELRAENSGLSREMAFQEAVVGLMTQKYAGLTETVEGQVSGVEKLRVAWKNFILETGQNAQGPVNQLSAWLAKIIDPDSSLNQEIQRKQDIQVRKTFNIADATGISFLQRNLFGPSLGQDPMTVAQQNAGRVLRNPSAFNWPSSAPRGDMDNSSPAVAAKPWERPQNQMDAMNAARQQMLDFEKGVNDQRLAEIKQYESQRASIISNYGKQVVREEQDFVRQRARGLRDYEKSIVDLMRDAQEREAEMQEDLDETLADSTEDSEKRIAKINKDYQKNREKDEKDHRDRLLKAAGSLDAIGVLEERRRWKRENEEKEEAHKESLDEEREALEERKKDAIEAHAERLEDARKADADRLRDMADARKQQLADEDEDRAIRNARAAEDFNDQLGELDRQHAITMQRLAEEAEEQRQLLTESLQRDLAEVGIIIEGYHEMLKKRDAATELWIENFIEQLEDQIKRENRMSLLQDPETGNLVEYASGGAVNRTGPAILHAGEFVLSQKMLASLAQNGSMSTSNRSININQGAIVVQTTPGYEYMAADLVEERMIELLGRV